ncbi:MAG: STAS domain-containing protein [Verrucomicrobia subdivision 3 bacterium]|nr:STAS domain-containing protein [Limisphaerales bacterium]
MKLIDKGDVLTVTEVKELGANNSDAFRDEVKAVLPNGFRTIEIDLSQTSFIDSCGLGALIAIYKYATGQNGSVAVRLLNPLPPVQQIFELTRLHRMFEIVRRDPA